LSQLPLRQSKEFACATNLPAQRSHPFPPGPLSDTKLHGLLTPSLLHGPTPARGITRAARPRQGNLLAVAS
jgi:hypothetical protein